MRIVSPNGMHLTADLDLVGSRLSRRSRGVAEQGPGAGHGRHHGAPPLWIFPERLGHGLVGFQDSIGILNTRAKSDRLLVLGLASRYAYQLIVR
jgi:hypothetical protein